MTSSPQKKFKLVWLGYAGMVLLFLLVGVWLLKTFLFADNPRNRRQIHMVNLVKPPPPPPPPPEEPPPPEPEQKIIEPEQQETPDVADEVPASQNLGVDAEGGAGGDSFGLVGNKGGRALIGGALGDSSLLRKYAWYTRMLQDEIRRELKRRLEKEGGWPDSGNAAKVKVMLDSEGRIIDFSMVSASGDKALDTVLLSILPSIRVKEPPPPDMPLSLFLRVSPKS